METAHSGARQRLRFKCGIFGRAATLHSRCNTPQETGHNFWSFSVGNHSLTLCGVAGQQSSTLPWRNQPSIKNVLLQLKEHMIPGCNNHCTNITGGEKNQIQYIYILNLWNDEKLSSETSKKSYYKYGCCILLHRKIICITWKKIICNMYQ